MGIKNDWFSRKQMQKWEFYICMQNGLDVLKENELWFVNLICSFSVENLHLWMVTNFVTCFCVECAKFAMHLLQSTLHWEFHCCVVHALLCLWQGFCVLLCFGSTEWNEVVTNWEAHFHHCNISKFVIFIHCWWIANFLRSAVINTVSHVFCNQFQWHCIWNFGNFILWLFFYKFCKIDITIMVLWTS